MQQIIRANINIYKPFSALQRAVTTWFPSSLRTILWTKCESSTLYKGSNEDTGRWKGWMAQSHPEGHKESRSTCWSSDSGIHGCDHPTPPVYSSEWPLCSLGTQWLPRHWELVFLVGISLGRQPQGLPYLFAVAGLLLPWKGLYFLASNPFLIHSLFSMTSLDFLLVLSSEPSGLTTGVNFCFWFKGNWVGCIPYNGELSGSLHLK